MGIVAVTGASGYIGGWVVSKLLDAGACVRACVRDPANEAKVGFLIRLASASKTGRLTLHKTEDMLDPESYKEAFEGATSVVHCAAVVDLTGENPQAVVDAGVEGTRNVVGQAIDLKCKRIIQLSSVSAVLDMSKADDHVFTEADWSTNFSSVEKGDAYGYAKGKSEEVFWQMTREAGIDAVAINPAMVLGPALSKAHCDGTLRPVKTMLCGEKNAMVLRLSSKLRFVDVRDVADAVVAAFSCEEAKGGRHILCNDAPTLSFAELAPLLRRACPQYKFPVEYHEQSEDATKKIAESEFLQRYLRHTGPFYDNSRSKATLMRSGYLALEATLKDSVASMVDLQFVANPVTT